MTDINQDIAKACKWKKIPDDWGASFEHVWMYISEEDDGWYHNPTDSVEACIAAAEVKGWKWEVSNKKVILDSGYLQHIEPVKDGTVALAFATALYKAIKAEGVEGG